jgi:ribosomal protein L7Ae-like RNA K-turn-binding protein
MLGFAMRAGRVVIGADQVVAALPKRGKDEVRLVLVSNGASDGTKKRMTTKCEFYRKQLIMIETETEELGRMLGKLYAPAVIAITDERFANEIARALNAPDAPSDN